MIITQTPLRISFLGGNTDLPEYYSKQKGAILTTTINKYIYCILKERKFDSEIRVNYSIKEIVKDVGKLKHELVREALRLVGVKKAVEITFISDIPTSGTGLGSSSAVTVGVLNALHNYLGEAVSPYQLAKEAIKIEMEILKKPIGIQDQYATALGGLRFIEINTDGNINTRKLEINDGSIEDIDNSLMLFYTGITRNTDSVLSSIDVSGSKKLLDSTKELTYKGLQALESGNLTGFGKLLHLYWINKHKLSKRISNKVIDRMYMNALRAGALGGKITGAGGGGFLLLMVPEKKRAHVRNRLKGFKELPFRISEFGSKVILNI